MATTTTTTTTMTMAEYRTKLGIARSLEYRGSMPKRGTKAREKYDALMAELMAVATKGRLK